jgi:hypothetical protein
MVYFSKNLKFRRNQDLEFDILVFEYSFKSTKSQLSDQTYPAKNSL